MAHTPDDTAHERAFDARALMQTFTTPVLAAAARGEIDLLALARQELASRGLDWQGKWIGFAAARALADGAYPRP